MKNIFLALVFALFISPPTSSAALVQADQDTPEAVAKAYMEATRAGDWAKCASLMHPEALKQIRGLFPFTKLDVLSLRRFENSWRAELKGDMQGIIQAMAVGMASASEEKEKSEPAKAGKPERKP